MVGAYSALMVGMAVVVAVTARRRRKEVRAHLRVGVFVSVVVFLLFAPQLVFRIVYLDPMAAMPFDDDVAPGLARRLAEPMRWGTVAGAVVSSLVLFGWRIVAVGVAELAHPERPAFPWLSGQQAAGRGWGGALALGAVAGLASTVVAWQSGVSLSPYRPDPASWFPDVDLMATWVVLGLGVSSALAVAVSEELWFRGLIQRWLERWLGDNGGAAVAIAATACLWTVRHVVATDLAVLRVAQFLVLGVVLGVWARRTNVEASIALHAAFNLVALAGAIALGVW